jgi:hypothetical protein
LARPGGNFTGVIFITSELGTKRLELLRQLAPKATTVAMLVMPSGKETTSMSRRVGPDQSHPCDSIAPLSDVLHCNACRLGLEGIVSKRLGSSYRSGRSRDWKMKNPAVPAVKREAEEDWGRAICLQQTPSP